MTEFTVMSNNRSNNASNSKLKDNRYLLKIRGLQSLSRQSRSNSNTNRTFDESKTTRTNLWEKFKRKMGSRKSF